MTKKPRNIFKDLPHDVRRHFILNLYLGILHLITHLLRLNEFGGESLQKIFEKYPFLAGYFEQMYDYLPDGVTWEEALEKWRKDLATWESSAPCELPLVALSQQLDVSISQRIALICIGLVEEDSRFGTLFAELQEPLAARRPGLELVSRLVLAEDASEDDDDPWQLIMPLLAAGLIEALNPEEPRSEWILRPSSALWDAIRGAPGSQPLPGATYQASTNFPRIDDLILPADLLDQFRTLPSLIDTQTVRVTVLRGMEGSERVKVMGAMARAIGKNLIMGAYTDFSQRSQWGLLGALCAATNSMPVIRYDMEPGETEELPALGAYTGPIGVLLGVEGGLKGALLEKSVTFNLSMPDAPQRRSHWKKVFSGHAVDNLAEIGDRFHIPGLYIDKVGSMAIAYAGLENAKSITGEHVRKACRSLNHQMLDTLASRLETKGSWNDLVVSFETGDQLQELEKRCRYRERVVGYLGKAFQKPPNWGVRALLSGPSGTGKTLAARILAARLGIDLYRVDLAAVVNKYIGETEKNLHRVLSKAEELDVVLLLDEGDALLGKRTDVKSANDRYANLETNYLLQRLENYQGIALITSNASENIDPAFQRRMDMTISFVPPEAEERWKIWQLHLSSQHRVDTDFLSNVASRCSMTGGQIRNAALHATLLAMKQDNGLVNDVHLKDAIESEYRKIGALAPRSTEVDFCDREDDLNAFVQALARE